MSADAIDYDLQNVECQRLLPVMEETFYRSGVGLAPGVKGTNLKWGAGSGNENFLTELSQILEFLHICLSEVDGPVPTRPPGSSIYDFYPVAKSRQDHHGSQSE